MNVEIITPDKTLFSGKDVQSIILPGMDGQFELLNGHAPLVSALKEGNVTVRSTTGTETIAIVSGMVECASNTVSVLIEG
jgi:F-type H+-transporting ATPase subunit epsilon